MRRLALLTRHDTADQQLTTRELEIAGYVARGMTNRDIASRLGIELCTVKNHVHNMLEKLGATRRIQNLSAGCDDDDRQTDMPDERVIQLLWQRVQV